MRWFGLAALSCTPVILILAATAHSPDDVVTWKGLMPVLMATVAGVFASAVIAMSGKQ